MCNLKLTELHICYLLSASGYGYYNCETPEAYDVLIDRCQRKIRRMYLVTLGIFIVFCVLFLFVLVACMIITEANNGLHFLVVLIILCSVSLLFWGPYVYTKIKKINDLKGWQTYALKRKQEIQPVPPTAPSLASRGGGVQNTTIPSDDRYARDDNDNSFFHTAAACGYIPGLGYGPDYHNRRGNSGGGGYSGGGDGGGGCGGGGCGGGGCGGGGCGG